MPSDVAIPTPEEKLAVALKAYAEESTYRGRRVVVTDYAAVLYVEEVLPNGDIQPSYFHITSARSSWHALRGLVATLVDHVARLPRMKGTL